MERLLLLLLHLAEFANIRIESLQHAAPCSFWRAPFSRGNFSTLRNVIDIPYDNRYGLLPVKKVTLQILVLYPINQFCQHTKISTIHKKAFLFTN